MEPNDKDSHLGTEFSFPQGSQHRTLKGTPFCQHPRGVPAPAGSCEGLETSQAAQDHSCAAAPRVIHSWGGSLAGLEAKAITARSDLGGNPNWFCMSSHFIQIKERPAQGGHLLAWGWGQKEKGYWNPRHLDFNG